MPSSTERIPLRFRLLKAYSTLLHVLLSYGFFHLRARMLPGSPSQTVRRELHLRNARRVKNRILELRGLFIKIGQLVSTLTNFLPEDFRQELEELQDRTPSGPVKDIYRRIEQELGKPVGELFTSFEPEALASASLAQVHRATMPDGREVAVKVQHPDIEEIARRDLKTIRSILRIVERVVGISGLDDQYRQLEQIVGEELDFEQEGANLTEIAANFTEVPGVSFPSLIPERSSHRVLTTTFVSGIKANDLAGIESYGLNRIELAEKVVSTYCRMIFADGLYHADPHPGNLIVQKDGTLVFLDFGAVAHLSNDMKDGIPRFLLSLLRRDIDGLRTSLHDMGFVPHTADQRRANEILDRFHERMFSRLNFDEIQLGDVNTEATMDMKMEAIGDMRDLDISFRELSSVFRIPKDWLLLERTVILLVGLCTHLAPEMNPLKTVQPYLEEHLLGGETDWKKFIGTSLREIGMSALALPDELNRFLTGANRGTLEVQVAGMRENARLLYRTGQQLVATLLLLGSAALWVTGVLTGHDEFVSIGLIASALLLFLLILSFLRPPSSR